LSSDLKARHELAAVWVRFCDSLKQQGEALLAGSRGPTSDQEFAEGIRHLGRIAVHALQSRVEFRDADFPGFYRVCDDRNRWGAPNADTLYLMAPYRGDSVYRIRGNCFGRRFVIGRLWSDSDSFRWEHDGSFEVVLSAQPRPGNWIRIAPDVDGADGVTGNHPGLGGSILVKIFDENWSSELPGVRMTIERIDTGRPDYPPPLTPALMARRLMDAETLARETWDFYEHHQNVMRGMVPTNELSAPVTAIIPGLKPDIGDSPLLYGFGFFALEPDEAWLIECDVPAEGHWSFQLYSRWYESLEFQHRQSSINRLQALIDDDGRFRAVISATDPGTVNWIDSEGHLQGCLIYRWLRCNVTPTATARVVKLSNLAELLPSKHFDLDARRRSEALSSRARHFSHLYQS
jgi:hypothetical protein